MENSEHVENPKQQSSPEGNDEADTSDEGLPVKTDEGNDMNAADSPNLADSESPQQTDSGADKTEMCTISDQKIEVSEESSTEDAEASDRGNEDMTISVASRIRDDTEVTDEETTDITERDKTNGADTARDGQIGDATEEDVLVQATGGPEMQEVTDESRIQETSESSQMQEMAEGIGMQQTIEDPGMQKEDLGIQESYPEMQATGKVVDAEQEEAPLVLGCLYRDCPLTFATNEEVEEHLVKDHMWEEVKEEPKASDPGEMNIEVGEEVGEKVDEGEGELDTQVVEGGQEEMEKTEGGEQSELVKVVEITHEAGANMETGCSEAQQMEGDTEISVEKNDEKLETEFVTVEEQVDSEHQEETSSADIEIEETSEKIGRAVDQCKEINEQKESTSAAKEEKDGVSEEFPISVEAGVEDVEQIEKSGISTDDGDEVKGGKRTTAGEMDESSVQDDCDAEHHEQKWTELEMEVDDSQIETEARTETAVVETDQSASQEKKTAMGEVDKIDVQDKHDMEYHELKSTEFEIEGDNTQVEVKERIETDFGEACRSASREEEEETAMGDVDQSASQEEVGQTQPQVQVGQTQPRVVQTQPQVQAATVTEPTLMQQSALDALIRSQMQGVTTEQGAAMASAGNMIQMVPQMIVVQVGDRASPVQTSLPAPLAPAPAPALVPAPAVAPVPSSTPVLASTQPSSSIPAPARTDQFPPALAGIALATQSGQRPSQTMEPEVMDVDESSSEDDMEFDRNDDSFLLEEPTYSDSQGMEIMCEICYEHLDKTKDLKVHMKDIHNVTNFKPKQKPRAKKAPVSKYKCKKCPATFTQRTQLKQHKVYHKVIKDFAKKKEAWKQKYNCRVCHANFDTCENGKVARAAWLGHRHEGRNLPVDCSVCSKSFENDMVLQFHKIQEHSGGTKQCPKCTKWLVNKKKVFANHMREHEVRKCDFCGHSFRSEEALKAHVRKSHRQQTKAKKKTKPPSRNKRVVLYNCPHCRLKFSKKSLLEIHERQHVMMSLAYLCDACPIRFETMEALMHHKNLAHKKQTFYECSFCMMRFSKDEYLDRHEQTEHGQQPRLQSNKPAGGNVEKTPSPAAEKQDEVCILETSVPKIETIDIVSRDEEEEATAPSSVPCALCKKSFKSTEDMLKHEIVHSRLQIDLTVLCKLKLTYDEDKPDNFFDIYD